MLSTKPDTQLVSRKRVSDHGEVYTAYREVNAMLDFVKGETERIESRFLEPACGTGNFLAEVLRRKLKVVEVRYSKSQIEYERYAILAVTSIYGIDILPDNVEKCRTRLLELFCAEYDNHFPKSSKVECKLSAEYILSCNIVWGDALTLKTPEKNPIPIIFPEWSPVNGNMLKRRDFTFAGLIPGFLPQPSIFPEPDLFSDIGEDVFIPRPVRDYPLTHFLKLADAHKSKL